MNGVHDMGGLQDMGPIQHEKDEPVFHEAWEGRMYAINTCLRAIGKWNLDASRHQTASLPPVDYLRMTYYERFLHSAEQLIVKHGLVTSTEIATGQPDLGMVRAKPALTADVAARSLGRGIPSSYDPKVRPQFRVGQRVRARNMNPPGHTRLPRYARGKLGTITRDHGVYSFPDTSAHAQGEKRQHVYSVRFAARELWGERASPKDTVYLDMWDDYLEHA
jgi:nitrile hydratase beta subunit